jgi:hypothetical protein
MLSLSMLEELENGVRPHFYLQPPLRGQEGSNKT